jgi:hypothetical protein
MSTPMSEGRYRLLIAVLVVGAFAALFAGVRATDTGDDEPVDREVVERLIPGDGDEVIRQAELGIDLAPGYEGTLLVNGIEIPVDELRLVPEQNEVFFTPGEGKAVEELRAGPNCVEAVAWKSAQGRGTANDKSFRWCFEAL